MEIRGQLEGVGSLPTRSSGVLCTEPTNWASIQFLIQNL